MRKKSLLQITLIVISIVLLSGCNEQTPDQNSAPKIKYFTATPNPVIFGNSLVLDWSVEGATNVSIDNEIGNVNISGSLTVTPNQNQTYTLTAINSNGSSNLSIYITVINEQKPDQDSAPIIRYFTATPSTLNLGESIILNWFVEGATNISIDNEIGNVNISGSLTVTPNQNQTYTLTAINSNGSSNLSIYITVINEQTPDQDSAPIIRYFTATPNPVKFRDNTTFNWFVEGANSVSINNGIGEVGLNGPLTFKPTVSRKYILTATNEFGTTFASFILLVE